MVKRFALSALILLLSVPAFAYPIWYRTQFNTGVPGNCGPASVAMMASWANGEIVGVPDARSKIGMPHPDGATSIDDLERALTAFDVDYQDVDYREIKWAQIDGLLTLGYKLIVLVNLDAIDSPANLGQGLGGHYFVISGSRGSYFEIQDPYNGANIHFRKDVVTKAMTVTRFIMVKQTPQWWKRHGLMPAQYVQPVGICETK